MLPLTRTISCCISPFVLFLYFNHCSKHEIPIDSLLTDSLSSNLDVPFNQIGETVDIPLYGDPLGASATIVDLDDDGTADGLDLDGDGIPEFVYITDPNNTYVGLDLNGDFEVDYYIAILSNGQIVLTSSGTVGSSLDSYSLVADASGIIVGIDTNGDGQADDERLEQIAQDSEPPTVNAGQPPGVYTEAIDLEFYCNDDYACNHIAYTIDGPTGIQNGIIKDFDNHYLAIGADGSGEYTISYQAFDYGGNAGEPFEVIYSIVDSLLHVSIQEGSQTGEDGSTVEILVQLLGVPQQSVDIPVNITAPLEASASTTLITLDSGTLSAVVTITGLDDDYDDGDQSYQVQFGPTISAHSEYNSLGRQRISLINVDDDQSGVSANPPNGLVTSEGGGADSFDLVLDARPTDNVVLNLATQSGTNEQISISPTSVTFTPGNWDIGQTITVAGQDDGGADLSSDSEVVLVTVSAATTDSIYKGLSALPQIDVLNVDNDSAQVIINPLDSNDLDIGAIHTVAIYLSAGPSDDVTIGFGNPDPSTLNLSTMSMLFTTGNYSVPQNLVITAIDGDSIQEAVKNLTISTSSTSSDGTYNSLDPDDVDVMVTDDDVAGLQLVLPMGLSTSEDLDSTSFTVALTSEPASGSVNIDVSTNNTGEGSISSASTITFTSTNWSVPQTVNVTGVDDTSTPVRDGSTTYQVVLNPSGSAEYNSLSNELIDVENHDNDRFIFASSDANDGDLGGVSGADSMCNNDLNRPDMTVTYKAMITDGVTRIATINPDLGNGQTDWVLEPYRNYMRTDKITKVFTANGVGLFDFSATNWNNSVHTTSGSIWTGLKEDWTVEGDKHCENWTDGSDDSAGNRGRRNQKNKTAIDNGNEDCDANYRLYCVEQP